MAKVYAIMGATGHIGHVLTLELLQRGHRVKALGRNLDKLNVLKAKGAETIQANDLDALSSAFKDVDAVFTLIPPPQNEDDYGAYQDKVGEATTLALRENRVPFVLNLSSIGAELPDGTGPIKGLYRQEQRLNTLTDTQVLHLRPAYFMENLLMAIPVIKFLQMLGTPLKNDLPIPMVATKDIGLKAAEFLDSLTFKGYTVFDFVGPRTVTMTEVAEILGKAIGKPNLKHMQLPYADAERGMITLGMKPGIARLMVEMYQAFNEDRCKPTQELTAEHHGKTTINEFAEVFANTYKK